MELELHHDDRTAECQLPPSRGTSRPRAAAPILHQPCQDQTREGDHAGSRGSLMAAFPGDDGEPTSQRASQPAPHGRAASAFPTSAATCTHAGRKTEGPLYGAAAPGGGGRTGLDAEQADAAEHLPQPSGPHPATLRETRPVTEPQQAAAAAAAAACWCCCLIQLSQRRSEGCRNRVVLSLLRLSAFKPINRSWMVPRVSLRRGVTGPHGCAAERDCEVESGASDKTTRKPRI